MLLVFSTSFWWIKLAPNGVELVRPTAYTNHFNIILKYAMVYPHHFLAVSLLILVFFVISSTTHAFIQRAVSVLLAFAIGFIHPYIALYTIIMVAIYTVWEHFRSTSILPNLLSRTLPFGLIISAILLYYRYLLLYHWQSFQALPGTLVWARPVISLWEYIVAAGPIAFLAVPALALRETYSTPLRRLVFLWAVVPVILYTLGYVGLPVSGMRLVQLFWQIPFALLATVTLARLSSRFGRTGLLLSIGTVGVLVVYSIPPYIAVFDGVTIPESTTYSAYSLYREAAPVFSVLKTTPSGSVVLAGELLSVMIPTETSNRLVIGHEGTNPNYLQKRTEVGLFFSGTLSETAAKDILDKYNVSYIVFGLDSPSIEFTQYATYSYLRVLKVAPGITLAEVKR